MTWEPGYREVPAFDDPPEYEPDDVWQDAAADYAEFIEGADDDV